MTDFRHDIEKYRKGELTSAEMHALEKKALSDPFLADALEGAESISPQDFEFDMSEIDQKITSKSNKTVWVTPLRIAAGLVLLMGSFFLIYNFKQPNEQLASKEIPIPTTPRVGDSTSKQDERELLSLNQPKEEVKTEKEVDPKIETGPVFAKAEGSGEAKPTAGISTSTQTAPIIADESTKADQVASAELSKIALDEEKPEEREKISAAPVQQELRKVAVDKDMVSRLKAKKNAAADDQPTQRRVVKGQVTSAEDGLPLPGVNVSVKGTTTGTVTNMQGNYSISVESEQQLVFSFIGLHTSEVSLSGMATVDVKLLEDVSQLSEVVVTGQDLKSDQDEGETPVIKLAEPFGGRKAYDQYLENNLRYPQQALESKVKGNVTINFIVGTDGTLRDFNVMRSLGYGCDDEVVRLVKEGPKWSPTLEDNVAIESKVRIKMKFDAKNDRK